jgi:23S rRNA pseudouridine2605 synthase
MARGRSVVPESAQAAERVQKILARAGLASRREAEAWISAGRVTVNGEVATLGAKALGSDQVRVDGRLVRQASSKRSATWLCHRSPGENLLQPREAGMQEGAHDAMSERLSRRVGRRYVAISPMPHMDGGLELLTSDGNLAAQLQRAVRGLRIQFSLRVRGELAPEQLEGVMEGQLDSGEQLQIESCEPTGGEGSNRWYAVETIGANGKELRLLVERQGAQVSRILRTGLGGLTLERTLSRGHSRQLTDQELALLLSGPAAAAGDMGAAGDAAGAVEAD